MNGWRMMIGGQTSGSARSRWATGLLALCTAAAVWAQPAADVRIEAFGEAFAKAEAAPAAQARVFVYRTPAAIAPAPVNIYLNGSFHTALLRGGYTEFCVAPGALAVQSALDDASRLHQGKREPGQQLSFAAGQVQYLRVQDGAVPSLQPVTPAQAQSELAQTRRQIHVVSRAKAAQECQAPAAAPPAPPPPPKPPVPRQYALEADALFEFNSAELRADGFNAIELLIQRLRSEYTSVERIRVLGFTDPIGSRAINDRLSEQRAKTVADQLLARGMRPSRGIETEGLGSRELAKFGCGNAPTPQNKACHAPNRRVVIVVIGAAK